MAEEDVNVASDRGLLDRSDVRFAPVVRPRRAPELISTSVVERFRHFPNSRRTQALKSFFAFRAHLVHGAHAELPGFPGGKRLRTLARRLKAWVHLPIPCVPHGQRAPLNGANLGSVSFDAFYRNGTSRLQFIFCRSGEEGDPALKRGFPAIQTPP